jgi:hypothetical protein
MKLLTATSVTSLMLQALYTGAEIGDHDHHPPSGAVMVSGVVRNFGFHPERLKALEPEVKSLIQQLSPKFLKSGGGGASFLELPFDANGEQWGEQMNAEDLLALAVGLGLASMQVARVLWPCLPGGVPYVCFNDTI